MFNNPTVLIIGAGASAEFGMPLGSSLMTKVANAVTLGNNSQPNDALFSQRLRSCLGNDRGEEIFKLGAKLASVVSQFKSMDEALHFLSDEPDIVELGKLAIAHEVMNAERNSQLFKAIEANDPGAGDTNNTWANAFLRLALSASRRQELSKLFANVTVIDFNYDRVLPQYLYWVLQRNLEIPKDAAAECVRNLTVLHPYGSLGQLEWQSETDFLTYGADHGNLAQIGSRIRTYTEEAHAAERTQIETAIGKAEVFVVIGFGFHRQNIKIVSPAVPFRAGVRAFLTVYAIGDGNHDAITREMRLVFRSDQPPVIFTGIGNAMLRELGLSIGLAAS